MENTEIPEELKKIFEEAKDHLSQIKGSKTRILNKINDLEATYTQFETLRDKVNNGESGLNAVHEKAKTLKTEVEQFRNDAENKLNEISSQLSSTTTKVQEIENFYTQFETLRDKVNNGESGLNSVHEKAKTLKTEVEQFRNDAESKLNEINNRLSSATTKVQEIENFYTQFETLRDKVNDGETGLQAILDQASDLENKIVDKNKSTENTYLETRVLFNKVEELKTTSQNNTETIEKYKDESESLKQSIADTLTLVNDSSLRNEFNNRKREIIISSRLWLAGLIISTILLAGAFLYIYKVSTVGGLQNWHEWSRYLYGSPLIYLVYVCSKNYGIERDLLEKYAFKAVISTSLQSFIKLLNDNFPEEKKEIINFTLRSTNKIYKEPYKNNNKRRKYVIGFKNIFNVGIEDEELNNGPIKKSNTDSQIADREKGGLKKIVTEKITEEIFNS